MLRSKLRSVLCNWNVGLSSWKIGEKIDFRISESNEGVESYEGIAAVS